MSNQKVYRSIRANIKSTQKLAQLAHEICDYSREERYMEIARSLENSAKTFERRVAK